MLFGRIWALSIFVSKQSGYGYIRLLAIVAFILVCAFCFHAVSLDHFHPGDHHSEGLFEYLHGQDRKWIPFVAAVALFIFSLFVLPSFRTQRTHVKKITPAWHTLTLSIRDSVQEALRCGVIAPQLYG
ncbi:hypothetical protein COU17_01560 [Candidatus Kaiserbacteria bacterium CG10_big_fil_rev_8_21_14_0_10_49_17]|uniref:Uncharacterized protein n=1 Tax=Candidatus Kaiserbacteria bacterium CG10_big_fil_rev_8_21_14_0_10_49_17 TaxID=1974609 RepID=A0A2M6WER1_9BACT|nr:MAG: hypothetical protein COU17_01560 [Candidatus Kaiserbacteria bacterium CG10_big_fil_rev_8_21_14_0_10_49_17]